MRARGLRLAALSEQRMLRSDLAGGVVLRWTLAAGSAMAQVQGFNEPAQNGQLAETSGPVSIESRKNFSPSPRANFRSGVLRINRSGLAATDPLNRSIPGRRKRKSTALQEQTEQKITHPSNEDATFIDTCSVNTGGGMGPKLHKPARLRFRQ